MAAKTVDDKPDARTAPLKLSHQKLKALQPELYSSRSWQKFLNENGYRLSAPDNRSAFWKEYIESNLQRGECGAAVVVSESPLLVAAYAGEIDCVAMLRFADRLAAEYGLRSGSRLLAVNIYLEWNFFPPEDLKPGPRSTGKFRNFAPMIADFLIEDPSLAEEKKAVVSKAEWDRAESMAREYMELFPGRARDGRPLLCHLPAKTPVEKKKTKTEIDSKA
jgi:hypothetical protein